MGLGEPKPLLTKQKQTLKTYSTNLDFLMAIGIRMENVSNYVKHSEALKLFDHQKKDVILRDLNDLK